MSANLEDLAQRLVGPQLAVVAGRVEDLQGPLWPEEKPFVRDAAASRLKDFTAGRTAARLALAKLGVKEVPIPRRGPHGAPLWPRGVIGSISHAQGHCIAIVGRESEFETIGIDIEGIGAVHSDLAPEICRPTEMARIGTARDALTRVFSAKEALFKAQYPLSRQVIGFEAVEICLTETGFNAIWQQSCPPFLAGQSLTGQQGMANGLVLSILRVCRQNPENVAKTWP